MHSDSEDEAVEAKVELGFVGDERDVPTVLHGERDWSKWDGGQLGGCPSWLHPLGIPSTRDLECTACHVPLTFLLQLYCPLDDITDAFHRTLYVFICRTPTCRRQGDGLVFRLQLPRVNPFYASQGADATHGADGLDTKVALCVLCGLRASITCTQCHVATYCSTRHQDELERMARDKDTTTCGHCVALDEIMAHGSPWTFPNGKIEIEEEPDPHVAVNDVEAKMMSEFERQKDQQQEDDDDDTELNVTQQELNEALGHPPSDDQDEHYVRFLTRVALATDQVVRYARWKNDAVLWLHANDRVSSNDVPPCERCGAARKFEFQVMPQLVNYLNVDHDASLENVLARSNLLIFHQCSSSREGMSGVRRVFSGIQPTGAPHLGNYCGAIAKWVALQDAEPATRLYSIVDLHAITVPYDAKRMSNQVHAMVAALVGAGLDPDRNILFRQSDVAAHTELAWLLSCLTPLGWLQRMTQFKQKAASAKADSSLGLLAYPVLMAADILLYRATHVPVGADQQQHLELTRMIATTFNDRFGPHGKEVLVKPFPIVGAASPAHAPNEPLSRIMSLRDPTKKMSKSDASARSRIELTDTADEIRKKIRKATTDAVRGISYDREKRPGVANLLAITSAVTGQSIAQLEAQYADYSTSAFKDNVADAVIATICPIGKRIQAYEADRAYITNVLRRGAAQASELAAVTMKDVKDVMHLA
ncbi:hypothetical protein PsorP6_003254 [Peronosclerospora sorghi]|uniref:Uncharacterized protein n=1 Tax=Peronosclerospora sorghi TaxID=230839 RepID=A0ACC0VME7_9STRA|nr:hypothetical protein PsorP6_003254 [Peronosclerospora sorghi]